MSSDLRDLYQDVILDHGKKPRNARVIEDATFTQPAYNPLCGDKGTLYLSMDPTGQKIVDAAYVGQGCSISTASASIMTDFVRGKTREEALNTFGLFHDMITSPPDEATHRAVEDLGKLSVFSGVAEFPARVKCATLAWHALKAALTEGPASAPVSTE
ncbi:MAG TPA: SUF system NifU family Fe-S cluster assembly protein [Vicinamibacteria bacterium]|nr:SUF system NifU family Fe-S cluster assembly protein [Vicinamibacteria bacterium]